MTFIFYAFSSLQSATFLHVGSIIKTGEQGKANISDNISLQNCTVSKKVDMPAETCNVCSSQSRVLQPSESSDVIESSISTEEHTVAMDVHSEDVVHRLPKFVSCGQLLQVLADRFYWMTYGRNLRFLADRFYCLQLFVQITTGGNIT